MLFVLFALSLFTFVLSRAVPGGPWDLGTEVPLTEKQIELFKAQYGLDKPVFEQYLIWLRNAITFDFGTPYTAPELTVAQLIMKHLPYSVTVGGVSAVVALIVGITAGMVAAARHNTWLDSAITFVSVIGGTIPGFILGFVLVYVFSVKLGWLPAGGWDTQGLKNLILPITAFGLPASGGVARWTRQCMLEAMSSDYVRTAHAKGLRQRGVMIWHVLRNSLIPMMTSFLPMFPSMMTGSVFIERTFGIPGLGQYFTLASTNRDYPLVIAITLFWAGLIALTYFLTDILYGLVDPRVRLTERSR